MWPSCIYVLRETGDVWNLYQNECELNLCIAPKINIFPLKMQKISKWYISLKMHKISGWCVKIISEYICKKTKTTFNSAPNVSISKYDIFIERRKIVEYHRYQHFWYNFIMPLRVKLALNNRY